MTSPRRTNEGRLAQKLSTMAGIGYNAALDRVRKEAAKPGFPSYADEAGLEKLLDRLVRAKVGVVLTERAKLAWEVTYEVRSSMGPGFHSQGIAYVAAVDAEGAEAAALQFADAYDVAVDPRIDPVVQVTEVLEISREDEEELVDRILRDDLCGACKYPEHDSCPQVKGCSCCNDGTAETLISDSATGNYVYDPAEHRAWGPFPTEDEANAFIESDKYLTSWCVVTSDLGNYNKLPVYAPKEYHGTWPV